MKRQATDCGERNIGKSNIWYLIVSRMYKHLSQLSKKTSNPIQKWAKNSHRPLKKTNSQHTQEMLTAVGEMQIRTTLRNHNETPLDIYWEGYYKSQCHELARVGKS